MQKVLIVEDEISFREIYNDLFISNNYQTITSTDGEDGLYKMQKYKPDLIVLDMGVPKLTGRDFIIKMQQMKCTIPVIVVSDNAKLNEDPELYFAKQIKACFSKSAGLEPIYTKAKEILTTSVKKVESFKQRFVTNPNNLEGVLFANCRLEKLLGASTHAVVYRAQHVGLNIPVTIKMWFYQKQISPQFLEEINGLVNIKNKNLLGVLNGGFEDEVAFLTMPYTEGKTLAQIKNKFSPDTLVKYIVQLASGLSVAHEQGFVHANIKPSNILISQQNKNAILLDFHISQIQKKVFLKDALFLSPEQCLDIPADTRTDIYSLGAVFYHLLTGCLPFEAKSIEDLLLMQALKPIVNPYVINPKIPMRLSNVIAKMMHKSPKKRYQNLLDVVDELETKTQRLVKL